VKTQSPDTSPEAEAFYIEGLRRMSGEERLLRAFRMGEAVRALAAARIRAQYGPDLSERELLLRLGALWIDRETMIRVFDWDPELKGY